MVFCGKGARRVLIRSDDPFDSIDLAHTPDFTLGGIAVRPSSREIECRSGREILEPRVMQVLVALAEAGGAVVSRDDLVRRCWDGRSVGEDAINRCIAKLRRIAESGDTHSFAIDTIPRVGYRLLLSEPAAASPPFGLSTIAAPGAEAVVRMRRHPPAFRYAFGVAAVALVSVVAVIGYRWMLPKQWAVDSSRPLIA